jgi:hypothetical protein
MFKRVFSRKQPENVSKSIRCTKAMWDAIEQLASEAGETANSYIVLVLDQYLQAQLENGALKAPDSDAEKPAS